MAERTPTPRAKRYRALRPLDYPTDAAMIQRLASGEDVPLLERNMKRIEAGAIVTDLPQASIPILLRKGWIEEIAE